jgi:hypothetical protein
MTAEAPPVLCDQVGPFARIANAFLEKREPEWKGR